jgi:hypothetical protein
MFSFSVSKRFEDRQVVIYTLHIVFFGSISLDKEYLLASNTCSRTKWTLFIWDSICLLAISYEQVQNLCYIASLA